MKDKRIRLLMSGMMACGAMFTIAGCREHMPHSFTWPATGDQIPTHPKPPEGGYYTNWDPFAVTLEVTPIEDVNPVRTQHVLIATVRDKNGKALPNRRVEWMIAEGSIGDIVEVDESGWRASRGYKVDNHYAVSHTNCCKHVLDRGNSDPSDDIILEPGQTWCVITSPVEGDTHITAYAPGIYDWSKHKVFVKKHWYDIKWECPPPATNPTGTTHEFVTRVSKFSDDSPLAGYLVTYQITDGPSATLSNGGQAVTDANGNARVTISQAAPAEGTNNVTINIVRPENAQCCKPAAQIATCNTSKTWVGPKIGISKQCTPSALVGGDVNYTITVNNPSQVTATNVVVTDAIPDGISYVSSNPSGTGGGSSVSWNLGSLAGGASSTIQVNAKATRVGRFTNRADVRADQNLSATDQCDTVMTSPQLQLEKRCTPEILICDMITYTIVVRNSGDGVASGVRVEDNLPQGITTSDGRTSVTQDVGDLGPGQSKEISFQAKAANAGRFVNTARATGNGGLTAEASCETTVRQVTISVNKTGPGKRYIGRPIPFEITVTNSGDTAARNVMLEDPIPAGTEFVSASDGGSMSGGKVTWNLGEMAPGATRTVTITLKSITATSGDNVARVSATCAGADARVPYTVEGLAAILLEVVDENDPVEVGTDEVYTIIVTNQGSANDTNIRIVATIPDQMDYVSSSGATNGTVAGKVVTFEPLGSLAPKARATWKVVTKGINTAGVDTADVRFKVELNSDVTTTPVNETESTHIYE